MTDAGYVITGWALTAGVLTAYWASVARRTRRTRRTLPPGQSPLPPGHSPLPPGHSPLP